MWIMTQTKNNLVNTSQIINIWADRRTCAVRASAVKNNEVSSITLGIYDTYDICLGVLNELYNDLSDEKIEVMIMPLGGDAQNEEY